MVAASKKSSSIAVDELLGSACPHPYPLPQRRARDAPGARGRKLIYSAVIPEQAAPSRLPPSPGLTRRGFLGLAAGSAVAAAAGCLPSRQETVGRPSAPSGPAVIPQRSTLVVASTRITPALSGIGSLETPDTEAQWLCAAGLATIDCATLETKPWMAEEVPSIQRGTWRINADGTMVTTYKLRPGVRWHDGSPMLADDWIFGWEVDRDPALPNATSVPVRYIESLTAPDESTLVLLWTQTYPYADALVREAVNPVQRAKHESTYKGDRDRFINSPAWNFEYVGLGPYRLAEWTQGSHIRYEAFDGFYRGKPKTDVIVVRFLQDPNTLMANVLSDSVDVYLPLGLSKEAAVDLQKGWAAPGTGNQLLVYPDGRLRYVEFQMRPDQQRPRAIGDRRVREAMYRAIDRQELMEAIIVGLGRAADSWVLPDDPARGTVYRGAIPDYTRNVQAAGRLLEEAGFRRGPDGTLVHQQTGERFETAVWNTRGGNNEKENAVVSDHMRSLGIAADQYIIPTSRMDDGEHRASFPGANLTSRTVTLDFENAILRYRPPRATEPLGTPRNGYNNPQVIALVDRLQVTVPQNDRAELQREIMQIVLQEMPIGPLYWDVEMMTIRRGISGPAGRTGRHVNYPLATWNVAEWDRA